jgi:hypothetical protein
MVITITSIHLKSLWMFFRLSYYGLLITQQAKKQPGFIKLKNTGFGYDHYTLTAWEDEASQQVFAKTGAHLQAMKKSAGIATEIRTYSFSADQLPDWNQVRSLLKEKGKVIRFK